MGAEVPITTMCRDNMVPHFWFDHRLETLTPTRDQREDADASVVPDGAITIYTDGSSEPSILTFMGPEPSSPISHTVIKTAIWDTARQQHNKCWQETQTSRQTKEMIKDRCRRRESDLWRLPRQTLRLVIGVLMGHAQLNRHLSIMGVINDPSCNQCSVPIDNDSHFLCHCDSFITLWRQVWRKSYLHKADIDHAAVRDLERFIKKISQIHPELQ